MNSTEDESGNRLSVGEKEKKIKKKDEVNEQIDSLGSILKSSLLFTSMRFVQFGFIENENEFGHGARVKLAAKNGVAIRK